MESARFLMDYREKHKHTNCSVCYRRGCVFAFMANKGNYDCRLAYRSYSTPNTWEV